MKKVSKATIVNRIKSGKNICPICGCKYSKHVNHGISSPELYEEEFCCNCGTRLGFSGEDQYLRVCDFIRDLKDMKEHIKYRYCIRIAQDFNKD